MLVGLHQAARPAGEPAKLLRSPCGSPLYHHTALPVCARAAWGVLGCACVRAYAHWRVKESSSNPGCLRQAWHSFPVPALWTNIRRLTLIALAPHWPRCNVQTWKNSQPGMRFEYVGLPCQLCMCRSMLRNGGICFVTAIGGCLFCSSRHASLKPSLCVCACPSTDRTPRTSATLSAMRSWKPSSHPPSTCSPWTSSSASTAIRPMVGTAWRVQAPAPSLPVHVVMLPGAGAAACAVEVSKAVSEFGLCGPGSPGSQASTRYITVWHVGLRLRQA